MCGFQLGNLPDETQFYRFLKKTKNSILKDVHKAANDLLIEDGLVSLDEFILDSKPVMAATKENNFKNPNRNTRNKTKKPKRNPRATLSYYSCQVINGKKENMVFFWGYRTHTVVTKEGICLVEKTLPNNITDAEAAFSLIKELKRRFRFKKGAIFIGDKAYDLRKLYTFIVEKMKSQPYIPINPRNQKDDKSFGPHGCPVCDAGIEKPQPNTTMPARPNIHYSIPENAMAVQNILTLPTMLVQGFQETANSSKKLSKTDRLLNSISLVLVTEKSNKQHIIRLPPLAIR
jgi:hypothetical protein